MEIIDGWLDGVKHVRSPNFNQRPPDTSIDLLVIHNISLPPGNFENTHIENFFQNNLCYEDHPYFESLKGLKVSSHFLIKRSGEIVQFVSCNDRAWHAGTSTHDGRCNCNDFSIGVELEGTDDLKYCSQQYTSLITLTKLLQCIYPEINKNIVGHENISPGRKTDPGKSFDWIRYRSNL